MIFAAARRLFSAPCARPDPRHPKLFARHHRGSSPAGTGRASPGHRPQPEPRRKDALRALSPRAPQRAAARAARDARGLFAAALRAEPPALSAPKSALARRPRSSSRSKQQPAREVSALLAADSRAPTCSSPTAPFEFRDHVNRSTAKPSRRLIAPFTRRPLLQHGRLLALARWRDAVGHELQGPRRHGHQPARQAPRRAGFARQLRDVGGVSVRALLPRLRFSGPLSPKSPHAKANRGISDCSTARP